MYQYYTLYLLVIGNWFNSLWHTGSLAYRLQVKRFEVQIWKNPIKSGNTVCESLSHITNFNHSRFCSNKRLLLRHTYIYTKVFSITCKCTLWLLTHFFWVKRYRITIRKHMYDVQLYMQQVIFLTVCFLSSDLPLGAEFRGRIQSCISIGLRRRHDRLPDQAAWISWQTPGVHQVQSQLRLSVRQPRKWRWRKIKPWRSIFIFSIALVSSF